MVHVFVLVFLETSIINTFILMQENPNHITACNKTQNDLAHKEFRLQLARDLIGTYTACQTIGRPSHAEPIGRFTDRHFPIDLGSTAACVHCSNKSNAHDPSLAVVHVAISNCVLCVLGHIILIK